MHPLVELANKTIETFIKEGRIIDPPADLQPEFKEKSGVFVSIHLKEDNSLRGCIGTFGPTEENIAKEVIANAISASTRDPRFPPIEEVELKSLDISVDVLSSPVPVKDISELDAKKFGIIVSAGHKRGLLLPDLEGVDTPQHQIEICRMKGSIGPREPITLQKFTVHRYH